MDQRIYFAHRKLPLTFITLVIFTTSANQVLALDPKFNACEPKSCGQGPNISYPFWLPQAQESFCGYPNFEISCKGENPVLAISYDDYIIKDIFYTNHSFLVANSAAYEDACPISLHNLSLDRTSFNISPGYTSLSFFYNCLSSPPNFTYPLTCASNYTHSSFASLDLEMLELYHNDVLETCEDVVNAPVDTGGDFGTLFTANYSDILKMGFLLNWTAHNCSTCQTSGGRCGFENNQFICFCRDQPRLQSCDVGDRVNIERKVIVGVCAAVVSVIIMCLIFFIYQRRKKNQYASSSFVSRSTGSYLSSKGDMEKGMSSSFSVRVNLFSYEELEEATKNFASDRELGDGGFGTVYYGRLKDGREVAVKRLYENNYKRVEQFMNEVKILTRLRHQHLVALYGCTSRHSRELLLVYEYIPNGTVADNLHGEKAKPGALKWPTRLNIAVETATALSYLHAADIIHRDVKTNNILLDKNFCVKVADFGLSRLFPNDVSHISTAPQGTPGYVDPEYHQCYQLTSKSDVYSFGVVLIELISSLPAVDITRHRHDINLSNMAISKIQSNTLHEIIDPSLGFESNETTKNMIYAVAELAFQCLQSEKEARPSMEEVLGTLLEIQNEDNSTEKTDVVDVRSDDVGLLKKGRPLSPVSVTEKWISISSTPNTSG